MITTREIDWNENGLLADVRYWEYSFETISIGIFRSQFQIHKYGGRPTYQNPDKCYKYVSLEWYFVSYFVKFTKDLTNPYNRYSRNMTRA